MPSSSLPPEFVAAVRAALPGAPFFLDGDPGYDRAIAQWNIITTYRPAGVVAPQTAEEVSRIVKLAAQHELPQVVARGGGHSFEGLGLGGRETRALVIDTTGLDSLESDLGANLLTAGGGALFGHIHQHLHENDARILPTGSCVGVSIGGQIQSGGYGHYVRTYGPLVDRVVEIELVTPDGEIRRVNDTEHPDLFFALRGSGTGSFGVITKVVLRTNPSPAAIASFSVKWNLGEFDVPQLLKKIQDYTLGAPKSFNPMIVIWQGVLEVAGSILADSQEERDSVWRGLLDALPAPSSHELKSGSFLDTVEELELGQTSAPWYKNFTAVHREGDEHIRYMKIKAGFLPGLFNDDLVAGIGASAAAQSNQGARVQILALDPAWVPEHDTTSIKVRKAPWLMGMSVWLQASEWGGVAGATKAGEERLPWLNQAYEVFYPYTNGGYIGDDDLDEAKHGRDIRQSYFGAHLPRLVEIKRQYDPNNLFNHPLSIPTSL